MKRQLENVESLALKHPKSVLHLYIVFEYGALGCIDLYEKCSFTLCAKQRCPPECKHHVEDIRHRKECFLPANIHKILQETAYWRCTNTCFASKHFTGSNEQASFVFSNTSSVFCDKLPKLQKSDSPFALSNEFANFVVVDLDSILAYMQKAIATSNASLAVNDVAFLIVLFAKPEFSIQKTINAKEFVHLKQEGFFLPQRLKQ